MADRRLAFALGTAHLAILLPLAVGLGYSGGSLGNALANVGTLTGLALGAWFWVVNVAAAYWVVRRADPRSTPVREVLGAAVSGGALAGAGFIAGLLPIVFYAEFVFIPVAFVGLGGAALVGSLVAVILAGVDALVLTAVRRVLTASSA